MTAESSQIFWHREVMYGHAGPKKPLTQVEHLGGQPGILSILELPWLRQMLLAQRR